MFDEISEHYCEENQIQVVLPKQERVLTKKWIIIGYPGVDGIDFRVKNEPKNKTVFAYYPIENRYKEIAKSIEELVCKWEMNEVIL